ncbi:hypothetical protein [Viscerimonas tarda]
MRYYIDTNITVFLLGSIDEIDRKVRDILFDPENIIYISTTSIRELILLYKEGDLRHLKYKSYVACLLL